MGSFMVSLLKEFLKFVNIWWSYGQEFEFLSVDIYELIRRLQAVLNAAARLVFRLRRYDHVTDALAIMHWLRVPERVNFKLALMAYRVLNGMAPSYLNQLVPVSSLTGHRRLRSSFTLQLLVPSYRLSTVSRRSFPVAASMFWNTLPDDIQSAPSVSAFCRLLKTFLFQHSFPDVIL